MKLIFCMQVSMKACYKLIVWRCSRIPKVPKIASLQCLYSISKKNLKLKLIFSMQSFQKVYFNAFSIKLDYKVDIIVINGHDQVFSNYSNRFAISLQYLKNEIMNGDHFGMQINVKNSTSWYYPLWWKQPDIFKIPKIGSQLYFCNILEKMS